MQVSCLQLHVVWLHTCRCVQTSLHTQGLCLSYAAAAKGHANEAPRLSYLFIPLTMANESLFSWCRWVLCSTKVSVCISITIELAVYL